MWDQNDLAKTIIKALRANQFDVIALSSIVAESGLKKHPLTQLDRHPSPATNKAIATYLWDHVGERLVAKHRTGLLSWGTGLRVAENGTRGGG